MLDDHLTGPELGRSGHQNSVCYGLRTLSVKLGELNYFYQQRRFNLAEVGIESHVPFLFYDPLRLMPSWCDGSFIVVLDTI